MPPDQTNQTNQFYQNQNQILPTPSTSRKKLVVGMVVLVLAIVIAIIGASSFHKTPKGSTPAPSKPSGTTNTTGVQTSALAVVNKYLQAREDSVGVDQSSPTSWILSVQPITTTAWYAQLQPPTNSSTGTVGASYYIARSHNYIVKADATSCVWDDEIIQHTSTTGAIRCGLSDVTIDKTTSLPVQASTIPFGWVYTGQQIPPIIWVVNQNGTWLVNNDTTGQGQ